VRLLGSGAILREVLAAAELLAERHGVASEVFSATSYSELAREARERSGWTAASRPRRAPRTQRALLAGRRPVVAASDYVRAWPQLIAEYVDALRHAGHRRLRPQRHAARLRRFFEVDAQAVVLAALEALVRDGRLPPQVLADAAASKV
jgi:pyruvate dehydrogenase E1 component